MSASMKLVASVLIALLAVLALVAIRIGTVEVLDGVVLVVALAMLARTAIRTASDTPRMRRPHE